MAARVLLQAQQRRLGLVVCAFENVQYQTTDHVAGLGIDVDKPDRDSVGREVAPLDAHDLAADLDGMAIHLEQNLHALGFIESQRTREARAANRDALDRERDAVVGARQHDRGQTDVGTWMLAAFPRLRSIVAVACHVPTQLPRAGCR